VCGTRVGGKLSGSETILANGDGRFEVNRPFIAFLVAHGPAATPMSLIPHGRGVNTFGGLGDHVAARLGCHFL
jgi:hypothetical protein